MPISRAKGLNRAVTGTGGSEPEGKIGTVQKALAVSR